MHAVDEVTADTIKGWYVYGIVPADVQVSDAAAGIRGAAAPLEIVGHDDIAAVVSNVDVEGLGSPEDLLAHQRLLDAIAVGIPVLPFRFGAVLADRSAITDELLAPYHDEFADALADVTGRAQYVLRARYVEATMLRQVLDEVPGARALQEQIHDMPVDASREKRIRLGEMINEAIDAKRHQDTEAVIGMLGRYCVAVAEQEPVHELDAANVALLVEDARQDELAAAVDKLAADWEGQADVRLLGPVAPYDFVPQGIAEGEV